MTWFVPQTAGDRWNPAAKCALGRLKRFTSVEAWRSLVEDESLYRSMWYAGVAFKNVQIPASFCLFSFFKH